MWFTRLVYLSTLALMWVPQASAERYVVQDDAFGNTGATELSKLDEEERQELEEKTSQSSDPSNDTSDNSSPSTAKNDTSTDLAPEPGSSTETNVTGAIESGAAVWPAEVSPESTSEGSAASSPIDREVRSGTEPSGLPNVLIDRKSGTEAGDEPTQSVPSQPVAEELSGIDDPFLREYKRSEEQETDDVIRRLRERAANSDYDATLVDPADFVDSEDLLKGNVDSQGDQPFYITINAEGESDVIFYSPKVIQDEIDRLKIEEQISDAVIFLPPENDAPTISLPDNADPKALAILSGGGQESYFTRFTSKCCEALPNVGVLRLRPEQSAYADFKKDDFSYRFSDGDSRYRLVRLPDLRRKYLVTVKTFVKKYKRRGIDSGAFIPQVVILDRDKKVRRIISSMESRSYAETWTSYGYLKSVIEIDQSRVDADAFILLYTTAENLRRSTVIEDTSNQWEIRHMETGAVEIAVVEYSL